MPKVVTSEERLNSIGRKIGTLIGKDLPPDIGFGLFLFNYGDKETGDCGFMAWISNASRETMIPALKEWIAEAEGRLVAPPKGKQ
ncbi:hypothetical protein LCGC14_1241900 [marine sediment metagenome]|uniref:Uncharacterized protein n=1 Tax=marine sediment metagenome TaxID=412755 RepID=A0A0F9P9P1_9ZZZZ